MAKRRKKPALSTVVAFMSDERQSTLENQIEDQTQPLATLPLASIRPDPNQPRRLLPKTLNEALSNGSITPVDAVQKWVQQAELGTDAPAVRQNVEELKRLARSIAQHGLINPISVRNPLPYEEILTGVDYLIVTGERRYWAHVLLLSQGRDIHEGEMTTPPSRIKATITPPGITIRAHQFIENILREDINALERARGMWALRYELSGVNHGSPASEDDEVNHGSPAAEQVGLVPWREVESVLAISKRYRIFTTSVLKLCPEAQAIVEAHNLAERTVRPIVQKLADRADLQIKALQQLVKWRRENEEDEGPSRPIVAAVDELVEQLLLNEAKRKGQATKIARSVSSAPVVRFRKQVRQTLDFLNRLKQPNREGLVATLTGNEFADIVLDLRNLRDQLDAILTQSSQPQAEDQADKSDSTEA